MQDIKNKILSGKRLTKEEAIWLFESDDIFTLGKLASHASKKKNGNKAYFIRNIHINPTNICVNRCKFCAFSRSKGEEGAYEMTLDEIIQKLSTFNLPNSQLLLSERFTSSEACILIGLLNTIWRCCLQ